MVTSRERLNLHMEQSYPLEGLEIPDWESIGAEDALVEKTGYTAVQLLLQAVQRNQPDFSPETGEERTALVRICRLVVACLWRSNWPLPG